MNGRRGFSLVEMVIVLVLAGIVSTAAITMFSTQNRLNAQMTALGESQENARSAVQVAAAELRSAHASMVVTAEPDRLVLRLPLMMGVICGGNAGRSGVYFGAGPIDLQSEADGYAFRSDLGVWATGYRVRNADSFGSAARQQCIQAGNGIAGTDDQYAAFRVGGGIGTVVMVYREITYAFGPSVLDPSRRAFFRTRGENAVEMAQGFSESSAFEYLVNDDVWTPSPTRDQLRTLDAIRLTARVVGEATSGSSSGSASFELVREIRLRNTN